MHLKNKLPPWALGMSKKYGITLYVSVNLYNIAFIYNIGPWFVKFTRVQIYHSTFVAFNDNHFFARGGYKQTHNIITFKNNMVS